MNDGDALVQLMTDARRAGYAIRLGVGSEILITRGDEPGVAIPSQDYPTRLDTGEALDGLDGVRSFLGLA